MLAPNLSSPPGSEGAGAASPQLLSQGQQESYFIHVMADALESPPVLSTPAAHILDDLPAQIDRQPWRCSDDQVLMTYEVSRTVTEIRKGGWSRVALQFPDEMLPDAPRVYEALKKSLCWSNSDSSRPEASVEESAVHHTERPILSSKRIDGKLYILADTSYGSCCVDELAAEHVNADVVVHYGRSCLSPTARLPVIYIFTIQPLAIHPLLQSFQDTFPNRREKVILMADVPYSSHLPSVYEALNRLGYSNLFTTEVEHNPSSPLPNRTIPDDAGADATKLKQWHLFYLSYPPESLLLILSSRVSSIHVLPVTISTSGSPPKSVLTSTTPALRRRYALVTSVNTASIFGILINTLSVKNYLHIVDHVKARIRDAGKTSYTFVVGKVNAAKIANFSEIGGWVVIGCWESSLIESKDFWKPVLTPFELELALTDDRDRSWTGEWRSDFQSILDEPPRKSCTSKDRDLHASSNDFEIGNFNAESESAPPVFDLRTGRYVTDARPMQLSKNPSISPQNIEPAHIAKSLSKRFNGDLAVIGGGLSPGAEYLRSKRTWTGLGSDFDIKYDEPENADSTAVEEGRSGIAKGYLNQDEQLRR